MVAAAIRRSERGAVPFDPLRHMGPMTDLLVRVFGEELGPGARYVLRQMRHLARWGALGFWLLGRDMPSIGGFVWLEDGQVVGNVSLRRAAYPGGWMIGNVAVDPAWQRQGIGRALMETALDAVDRFGGRWVGLEVRDDRPAPMAMYESLGFAAVGTLVELSRPAGRPRLSARPAAQLRPARATDAPSLYELATTGLESVQQELLEMRPSQYRADWEARLSSWLEGSRLDWWVATEGERPVAALHLTSRRPARWHEVEVLVRPDLLQEWGPRLVEASLAHLARRQPWETTTTLPGWREELEPYFAAAGFQRTRRLVQMRRILGPHLGTVQ